MFTSNVSAVSISLTMRYLRVCHIRIQKISNLEISFKFLMSLGINLELSPEGKPQTTPHSQVDILNHSSTEILSFVWSLIRHFHLRTTETNVNVTKREFLRWLRSKGIDCSDLTHEYVLCLETFLFLRWRDGKNLVKLVNVLAPGSVTLVEDVPALPLQPLTSRNHHLLSSKGRSMLPTLNLASLKLWTLEIWRVRILTKFRT